MSSGDPLLRSRELPDEPTVDPDALAASQVTAKELTEQAKASVVEGRKAALLEAKNPYRVDLETQTFYFGFDAPGTESWEVRGLWVEEGDEVLVSEIHIHPSRRVRIDSGEFTERPESEVPSGGLNRDLIRSLASTAQITRAIKRERVLEGRGLRAASDGSESLPGWAEKLIRSANQADQQPATRGYDFEKWVGFADQYLAVVSHYGTKYRAQARLAGVAENDDGRWYWGVGEPGTRWRVNKLRERGLIDDSGPPPVRGPNHPRKETDNGKDT